MNKVMSSIILTGVIGLFSLIGIFLNGFFEEKNRKKMNDFIYGALFSIISMIIIIYLMPEVYNCLGFKHLYLFLIFLVIGYFIMKILNRYYDLPNKTKRTKKDMVKADIYVASMLVLIFSIYNLVIGLEIYSTMLASMNEGIHQVIIASFKNIFIGFIIYYLINQESASKLKKIASILLFVLTPLFGNILMICINKTSNALFLGSSFSLIIGMLLYILVTEIISNIKRCKNKNNTIIGIIIGAVLMAISYII